MLHEEQQQLQGGQPVETGAGCGQEQQQQRGWQQHEVGAGAPLCREGQAAAHPTASLAGCFCSACLHTAKYQHSASCVLLPGQGTKFVVCWSG